MGSLCLNLNGSRERIWLVGRGEDRLPILQRPVTAQRTMLSYLKPLAVESDLSLLGPEIEIEISIERQPGRLAVEIEIPRAN